jgi:HEPN domain-containing protein
VVDRSEFDRWRAEADTARRAAESQTEARLYNWACFLAEQSAQLAVKGLLHGAGTAPWGHDLVALGRSVTRLIDEAAGEDVAAAFQRLSRHYIPARYPDAHPGGSPSEHYGAQDARQALADLGLVLRYVDDLWARLSATGSGGDDGR